MACPVQDKNLHKKQQQQEEKAMHIDPPTTINDRPEDKVAEGFVDQVGSTAPRAQGEEDPASAEPAEQVTEKHPDKEMEKRT